MKNGWEGFNTGAPTDQPNSQQRHHDAEDREECWAEWKEAKELLGLRRDEFYAEMHATRAGRGVTG